ncbi:hypothetical protein V8F20_008547 [Naviculisporaceae sp. PSN 640]
MSWMDSWSRPGKHQPTPAPFYLLPNGGDEIPYCRSCGRVISSRKTAPSADDKDKSNADQKHQKKGKRKGGAKSDDNAPIDSSQIQQPQPSEVKYCSSRCRTNKPGKAIDRQIEEAFVKFLSGLEEHHDDKGPNETKKTTKKGDNRILVPCDVIEEYVFGEERKLRAGGDEENNPKIFGRKKNRASRVIQPQHEDESYAFNGHGTDIDGEFFDEHEHEHTSPSLDPEIQARLSIRSGTRIRPPQKISQVNGSVGGEKGRAERIIETDEMKEKRIEGQRRSHEREMVRSAARRGVVFGFLVHQDDQQIDGEKGAVKGVRKKCEAVMQGKVVEPSFAKGNWGVRWREE